MGSITIKPVYQSYRGLPLDEHLQERVVIMAKEHGLIEGADEEIGQFLSMAIQVRETCGECCLHSLISHRSAVTPRHLATVNARAHAKTRRRSCQDRLAGRQNRLRVAPAHRSAIVHLGFRGYGPDRRFGYPAYTTRFARAKAHGWRSGRGL